MWRLQPYFAKSKGRAHFDDGRVLSGIIFTNRNGLSGVTHSRVWSTEDAE